MREGNRLEKMRPSGRTLRAGALALALLTGAAGGAFAARMYPSAGSTSAAFLKLGVGARGVAMAGAFAGVPGDPYALYWNPAGLAGLDSERRAGLFHNEYFQGLGQEFLFYTAPAAGVRLPLLGRAKGGAYGLGLNYFYAPKDMERRSGLYEADPVNPISPVEGRFGAYDLAFSAGYGWKREGGLSLGAAVKVIRQSIDDRSGSSLALDLGLLREFTRGVVPYTAGFTVQNIGPGIKLVSRRYGLPLVIKAGLSRPLPGADGMLALEISKPVDNYPSAALGVEYRLGDRLTLRSGYRLRQHGNELGAWSGFSAGIGVSFGRYMLDYAFAPFGELGNSHRFSFTARFGREGAGAMAAPTPAAANKAALDNARAVAYSVAPRPLTISQRGIQYAIRAESGETELHTLTYKTLVRGEAAATLIMTEGQLPANALGTLPAGTRPLKAWQFAASPGNIQGGIVFGMKLNKGAETAGPALMYRAGKGWKTARFELKSSDEAYSYFETAAPYSEYYVLISAAGGQ